MEKTDRKGNLEKGHQYGTHALFNLYFEKFPRELDSISFSRKLFEAALSRGGFNILQFGFHQFKPSGVTGFFLLSESHLSFHTWPEKRYMALDLFTCGEEAEAQKTIDFFLKELKNLSLIKIEEQRMERGYVYQQQ